MNQKVLGVIPARGGSKGLVGKNIHLLGGIPLIVHSIRAARASRLLHDFVVSTDDQNIADIALGAGAKVPFLRPPHLASDTAAIWPTLIHAVEQWEAKEGLRLDAVALLQPTSPLRAGEDIDHCIQTFLDLKADVCITASLSHDSPYFNLWETDPAKKPFIRPCSPTMSQYERRQDVPPVYAWNGAVYVIGRKPLEQIGSIHPFEFPRIAVSEMPKSRSTDVDTLEDFTLAEFWLHQSEKELSR